MFEVHPIVLAVLTGFIAGLLISIPVGPVNLTIMNEGARNGFVAECGRKHAEWQRGAHSKFPTPGV